MVTKERITIREVAQEAGVSRQTVSRVINDRPDVAPETRKRINKVIARLGYQPNVIARSMARGSTHTLGCITPNLTDFNFSRILETAQAEARSQGFFILTGSAPSENEVSPLLDEMLSRRVDGLLVINPRDDDRFKYFLPLIEKKIPVVYLKNTPLDEAVSAVVLDDKTGGWLATQHLLQRGHSSIATILGPKNEECTRDRLFGYRSAMEERGFHSDGNLIASGDWTAQSGSDAIQELFEKNSSFSAVFAQNDQMAAGAIRELRKSGLRVPEDVSVIGYDDIPLASFLDPPLTTIQQPMDQFGRIGARLLIEAVQESTYKPRTVIIKPQLIERESCSPYTA